MQCIYWVLEGYVQRYSSETEGKKILRGQHAVPEGRRPVGTAAARGEFFARGWGGYIVVYSPRRPNIYNIYTTIYATSSQIFFLNESKNYNFWFLSQSNKITWFKTAEELGLHISLISNFRWSCKFIIISNETYVRKILFCTWFSVSK